MSFARGVRLSGMTIIAPTSRRRPASHAFVVPVVREVALPAAAPSAGDW
jgi:hypothetical protein